MKELKSTIIGSILSLLGLYFLLTSDHYTEDNMIYLYIHASLFIIGIYYVMTKQKTRKAHLKSISSLFIKCVRKKVNGK